MLTPRWTKLRYHKIQNALWHCKDRFVVVPAGRRSGKTELAKRKIVQKALSWHATNDGRFICAAPTHGQARRIYWDDLKALVPQECLLTPDKPSNSISESGSTIKLWNKARLQVIGMDKPERAEGYPIDGIILDEYGNMKRDAWPKHIRPALSTDKRLGWAWLIGVPEGRDHYYEAAKYAMSVMGKQESWEDSWSYYTWFSADILSPIEIAAAKRELDELTYRQEYEGSFINFTGRAYYNFDRSTNCKACNYDPRLDLILCFDFNVEPGTAVIVQEIDGDTCVIDEVYIPRNSNTYRVCDRILSKYAEHPSLVYVFGDATGGARGSAKIVGSDWDLIRNKFDPIFGDRLTYMVGRQNPTERLRVNAVNSRVKNVEGECHLFVNPVACPNTVNDFECVVLLEGGSGEIDKGADRTKTHLTDGLGYYIASRFPIRKRNLTDDDCVVAVS